MNVHRETKINSLLQSWPSGTVGLSIWLERMGVSRQLLQMYEKTGWLEHLGRGAYKRKGDVIDWLGALYALQSQAAMNIHIGGRTSLGLMGQAHYVALGSPVAELFCPNGVNLPAWFRSYDWGVGLKLHSTDFLPPHIGTTRIEYKLFKVNASGPARACMECLYLSPKHGDLVEAYHIMEGLASLQPKAVQELLECCRSAKVARLFLYMAEQAGHAWAAYIERSRIQLGSGKRSFAKGGVYVADYQMTVPRELVTR